MYLKKLNQTLLNHIQSKHFPGEFALRRMGVLMDRLGNPQLDYQVVHVAGTSGKGSTVLKIGHGLQCLGYRVGTTVSPHIIDVRERFQVNQESIEPDYALELIDEIYENTADFEEIGLGQLSFFEINLAIGFLLWSREKVDYAVVETGLGGKLDPTNILSMSSKTAVITHIDYDHQHILGNTLTEIAEQKAGIIWPGNRVVIAPQAEEAMDVLSNKIEQEGINDKFLLSLSKRDMVESIKDFTQLNTEVALLTIQNLPNLHPEIDLEKLRKQINSHQLLGRYQKINERTIIDGAHNPDKILNLTTKLKKDYPGRKFVFLLGIKEGKDSRKMLEMILPIASKIYLTGFEIHADMVQKGQEVSTLEELIRSINGGESVEIEKIELTTENTSEKLLEIESSVPNDSMLVLTGSTYFTGQVLGNLVHKTK